MTPQAPTQRDRGATLVFIALAIPVLVLMTSFAVDLGMLRSSRRTMQARADVVALDLARLADGRTEAEILGDSGYVPYFTASAARNDVDPAQLTPVFGTWTDASGFIPCRVDPNAAPSTTCVPDAAEVTARETTDYFFRPGSGAVTRRAVASFGEPTVDLSVGSVAAGVDPNLPSSVGLTATIEALNARLAAQFGATIPNPGSAGFDLVGYQGLADADVDLADVAAQAGFASPDELLASGITTGDFFAATIAALDQQAAEGDPNAANASAELERFQTQMGVDNTAVMNLGDAFQVEQGGDDAAATSTVNVLDLLTGGADVINGANFVSYQLAPVIPGVAVANVDQYIVQAKQKEWDLRVGGTATNKQIRFQLDLEVAPLAGMTGPLRIPLVVEAAGAIGTVQQLDCASPQVDSEALIGVLTSGVTVTVGTASDLTTNQVVIDRGVMIEGGGLTVETLLSLGLNLAQILGLDLNADTTASASASVLGDNVSMVFRPFEDPNPEQRAPGGIGAGTIGTQLSSTLSASLGNSLLGPVATTNLVNQLNAVFTNLDSVLIDPLLAASGVTIAGADVLAEDMECNSLKLVD